VCAREAWVAVAKAKSAFEKLYPGARIEIRVGTSREAISSLFGARCDLAVISRDLLPEERRAAIEGRLQVEGYPFARDALVMVVHPNNPVENAAIEDIRRVYGGEIRDWSAFGGRNGEVVPILQSPKADVTDFFVERVMAGEPLRARAIVADSDSEVVQLVSNEPRALGFVTLSHLKGGIRPLNVAPLAGLSYWRPDPEAIYKGSYPLSRLYRLEVRDKCPPVANGFITFLTSADGQKIVHEVGLVPTSIPVRFVRRSPMLGTHTQGDSSQRP
jgi:phosphate transport system substrate-binding protein